MVPVVFLLALLVPAAAQPARGPVTIPFAPRAGEAVRYRVERGGKERAGGHPVQSIDLTATAAVRVLAALPEGYRLSWTFTDVHVESEGGVVGPTLGGATAFGILSGLTVTFEVDRSAQPRRLLNGRTLRAAFLRAVRADEDRPGAFADLQAAGLREDFRRRLSNPTALADLVLDEPRLLALVSGQALTPGRPTTAEVSRESPLTSAPVRTALTVRLDSLGGDAARVGWEAVADREALVESIRAVLEAATPGRVDAAYLAELAPTLALEERATLVVGLERGWVRRAEYVKAARVAGRERIEEARFRLLR
ncbi:MAG TPA: hypothetical protein VD962_05290 [Rubricoccaceae bacterium]|nr:hypothetical protein [Rubricoccaceae bacterium]